ncbi:hypothetical protein KZ829_35755 [Actinoplanes hulinensis]|uniref:NACHT domain-containing protein n=1 Tax=Actinoplanes hulinensis TaxID=1144547 RepID=A0ABS7BE09_9ACTN|nr:hypothetical protein [Actinoplanes hulinensis]MBW6439099.1 hypothetical protein [Actinoplanes hulinensis]
MVKPARLVTVGVLALSLLTIPTIINLLTDQAPGWLKSPFLLLSVLVVAFAVVAADAVRQGRQTDGGPVGKDGLYTERLISGIRRTLDGMDRGSIAAEAGVQLGELARLPLPLSAGNDGITGAADLVRTVSTERGGFSVVVVGEPGSGKSTLLRDVGWHLVVEAGRRRSSGEEAVVPVPVDAGTWRGETELAAHLRRALRAHAIPPGVTDRWLAEGTLYLLVDNLGWLPATRRRRVIEELNTFRERYPAIGMLVCANEDDQTDTLGLRTVTVEPVSREQVLLHLDRAANTHQELRDVATGSAALVEVLRNRLFLTAALLAFPDRGESRVARSAHEHPREAIIWAYVESMLARDPGLTGSKPFLSRLSWIAKQSERMGTYYFHDYLVSGWLPGKGRRRAVGILIGVLLGLVQAAATAVILVPRHQTVGFVVAAALFLLSVGVRLPDWPATTEPVHTFRLHGSWSVREFRRGFRRPIGFVTIACTVFDLYHLWGHVPGWAAYDAAQRRQVLVFALVAVLAVSGLGFVQGWTLEAVDTEKWAASMEPRPFGRYLMRVLRWAAIGAVVVGAGAALVLATAGLILHWGEPVNLRPAAGEGLLVAAVVFVVVLVTLLGVRVEIAVVEALLRDDGLIPEDLPGFLGQAVRLSLLQRTSGGDFAFSHQILRYYFASREA